MKLRLFFIILFLVSTIFSGAYSLHFFTSHYTFVNRMDFRFVILLIMAVVLQMVAHLLRAYKSRYLLGRIREVRIRSLFKGLSVGYLFNSLLPLRLGEFIRAFYIGDAVSISKSTVFMSILIERLVDGIVLGLCFISAALFIKDFSRSGYIIMTKLGLSLLILSLVLAALISIIRSENKLLLRFVRAGSSIFNPHISNRIRLMAWSGIYGTRLMLASKGTMLKYCLVSLIMWAVYFCSTAAVVLAFFNFKMLSSMWFTIQSSYAGISTPAGPGYIGTFQLIVSHLLSKITTSPVDGFALFNWLIITIPIALIGIFVLAKQRFQQKKDAPEQDALINKLYREKDISAEFGNFLDAYFNGEEINRILTQAELDGKFKLIKSFKGGSNAHTMLVWQDQALFVKKITLPQFADKLQAQAQWLIERDHLPHLPRVVNEEHTPSYYSYDLEFHEDYFPFFDYIHSHTAKASYDILGAMLDFMDRSVYEPTAVKGGMENLQDYIANKILGKINDTVAVNSQISQLIAAPTIIINGKKYDNILQAVEKVRTNKQAMDDLANYSESPIHGDLTVDNLIASARGSFLLLDPNNENQVSSPVVDYGKLYQSLHSGYEFLIQLESCQVRKANIDFEDSKSQKYAELFSLLDTKLQNTLKPRDYHTILFHEAVHYCRMLTYRANINSRTLPVFYATAVRLFNEFLGQYDHKA